MAKAKDNSPELLDWVEANKAELNPSNEGQWWCAVRDKYNSFRYFLGQTLREAIQEAKAFKEKE